MKKTFMLLLAAGLVLFLGACNSNVDAPPGGGKAEDVEWGVDHLFVLENSEEYPGAEVDLSDRNLLDISKYASVTVKATLYSDEEGSTKAVADTVGDNLAQFKLLKATGDWDEESNICGPTKYNMTIDGDTTWNVPAGASGVPKELLLQANWKNFPNKVKSIKVHNITFTAKKHEWKLDYVYGGNKVTVNAGDTITFNDAHGDHAAILIFDPAWTALAGKSLKINFTIPTHTEDPSTAGTANPEHQLRIQGANSEKIEGGYKYVNTTNTYQQYPTLDNASETGWDATTRSGILTVELNSLLTGAQQNNSSDNDGYGPFTLNAIRLVNDGSTWTNTGGDGVTHVRCKSYTLVIDSVTVQ